MCSHCLSAYCSGLSLRVLSRYSVVFVSWVGILWYLCLKCSFSQIALSVSVQSNESRVKLLKTPSVRGKGEPCSLKTVLLKNFLFLYPLYTLWIFGGTSSVVRLQEMVRVITNLDPIYAIALLHTHIFLPPFYQVKYCYNELYVPSPLFERQFTV